MLIKIMTKILNYIKPYSVQLDNILTLYLIKKAPEIPENIKIFLVKFIPYLAIVTIIFSVLPIIFALGLGALFSPFIYFINPSLGLFYILTTILIISSSLLVAAAIPKLFSRQRLGWELLYYSVLIGVLNNILAFNLGALVLISGIGLYILFQIRSYYK